MVNIRRWLSAALPILFLTLPAGCRSPELDVSLRSPQELPPAEEREDVDPWDALAAEDAFEDPRMSPELRPAEESGYAPALELRDGDGASATLELAGEDGIMLVVFWSMDSFDTISAVLHADYLVGKYREYDVVGISIVNNPQTYHHASAFLDANHVVMDNYYDDFSALRRMSDAAGRDIDQELPCFFIIDGGGRVRFSKLGFSSSKVSDGLRVAGLRIMENAPSGERVEDYLRRFIAEEPDGR